MPSPEEQEPESTNQESRNYAEDGPKPMKDFKPSKTIPNSVDRFQQTHQEEYEARGRCSTDDVTRAQRHYAAYPALKDELDKRRSITRLTAVKTRRTANDSISSICLKLGRDRIKRKILRTRRQGRRNRRLYKSKEKRAASSRCTKEYNRNKRMGRKYMRGRSRRRSHTVKSPRERSREGVSPKEGSVSLNENKSKSRVGSSKNPSATSGFSVSSYNSYPSTEHEPMVS